jgi:hypothetical protein
MQYKYTAQYTDYGLEYMPHITAFVKNPRNGNELPLFWLVDSGATETLLPRRIGERLGIDIESGERVEFEGVGANRATTSFTLVGTSADFIPSVSARRA